MALRIQIISLLFSFVFGIFFSICTNLNYRYLFTKKLVFKIIITGVYIMDCSLLYFLIMRKINQGIINYYFILFVGLGYLFSTLKINKYVNFLKSKISVKMKKNHKNRLF